MGRLGLCGACVGVVCWVQALVRSFFFHTAQQSLVVFASLNLQIERRHHSTLRVRRVIYLLLLIGCTCSGLRPPTKCLFSFDAGD